MAKTKISEFSATPGNNTDIDGINIAEGCAPSGINDAIRELMAQLKDWQAGTSNDPYVVGSSGSLTLSYGTANGVPYLNGSKVLTSGSALTFDGTNLGIGTSSPTQKLDVFTSAAANVALFRAGAGQNSFLSVIGNGNSFLSTSFDVIQDTLNQAQLVQRANAPMLFFTNNTERMRIDSSGNVGIGTSSPTTRLSVVTASTNAGISVNDGTVNTIIYNSTGGVSSIGTTTNHPVDFYANNAARMRIDSSGNVGIGTSSPSAKLDVSTSINLSAQNYLNVAYDLGAGAGWLSGYNITYSSSSVRNVTTGALSGVVYGGSGLQFYTNTSAAAGTAASERMRIDTSGNVGIGTSSPAGKLEVYGLTGSPSNGFIVGFGANGDNYYTSGSSGIHVFRNAGTERARIDSSGNLLVGTTSFVGAGGMTFAPSAAGPRSHYAGSATANSSTTHEVYSTGVSAYRFYVGYGGTIFATSTSISAISDATLKENVRDLETGLTEVMALQPRRFDWKNGDAQNVAGFVAQEVEQVLPELVTDYVYNKDEDGNDIIKKSLKMGDILPTLVKAIQEQQAIITALTARVAALESN